MQGTMRVGSHTISHSNSVNLYIEAALFILDVFASVDITRQHHIASLTSTKSYNINHNEKRVREKNSTRKLVLT